MQIEIPAKADGRVMLWILLACIQILKQKKQIDGKKWICRRKFIK